LEVLMSPHDQVESSYLRWVKRIISRRGEGRSVPSGAANSTFTIRLEGKLRKGHKR